MERHQDVLLAGEVIVDRRLREAQPVGDLADGGRVVTLGYEEIQGYVEDPLPRAGLPRWATLRRRLSVPLTGHGVRHVPGHARNLLDGRSEMTYYPFGKYRRTDRKSTRLNSSHRCI